MANMKLYSPPDPALPSADTETTAMRAIAEATDHLEAETFVRVMDWAMRRRRKDRCRAACPRAQPHPLD